MVDFALQIEPQFGFAYEDIRELAHLCEEVGFASLWCSDHLFLDAESEDRNCWEAWTTLTGLAVETKTLRLGTLVTCTSYRYPSMLAKIAACVDAMSGGRLEFGIGAGWKQLEYEAYGIPFPPAAERVDRLEEAISIIQAMWTQPSASFEGRYYQIDNAICAPKPVQQPHPPLWVGGKGRRVLGLAGRVADGVNFPFHSTPEEYAQRLELVRAGCREAGRDFDRIKKSQFEFLAVAADSADLDRLLHQVAGEAGRTTRQVAASFDFVTVDQAVTRLNGFVELGVDLFQIAFPYQHEAESVRLMAEHVLPRLA